MHIADLAAIVLVAQLASTGLAGSNLSGPMLTGNVEPSQCS